MKLDSALVEKLCCPICQSRLMEASGQFSCTGTDCDGRFPVTEDGIPVLLNERSSLFRAADFLKGRETFFHHHRNDWLRRTIRKLIPGISLNLSAAANYREFSNHLLETSPEPVVLALGAGIEGAGTESLHSNRAIQVIDSDVALAPRTSIILDSHDIPFDSATFDGVVVQAVLEHVLDPGRCVEEIHRVLKPGGMVYAETPFMQQVHGGRYDFARFTLLGHRRLFRGFEEIRSGPSGGPGMALAWSVEYFMMSFGKSKRSRALLSALAHLGTFWLKYFDPMLAKKPGALDAAAGFYFLGRKNDRDLPDSELIDGYKGLT